MSVSRFGEAFHTLKFEKNVDISSLQSKCTCGIYLIAECPNYLD